MKNLLFLIFLFAVGVKAQNQALIDRWNLAGVTGGVPNITNIYSTVSSLGTNSISSSVNGTTTLTAEMTACNAAGGGVILFNPGSYDYGTVQLSVPSDVVLRNPSDNVDDVTFLSSFRAGGYSDYFIRISSSGSAIENIAIEYVGGATEPYDDISLGSPDFSSVYQNIDFANYRVIMVLFESTSSNSWLDGVKIYKSGNHPTRLDGSHNTIINSDIDRAYNKGGGGAGYFHIVGNDNLIINNTITRIRHINFEAPCCGFTASYNVFVGNTVGADINFHDADLGYNLIERNISIAPSYAFQGGGLLETGRSADGHDPPGLFNYIFNNDTSGAGSNEFNDLKVYTTTGTYNSTGVLTGFEDSGNPPPSSGYFYKPQNLGINRNLLNFLLDGW